MAEAKLDLDFPSESEQNGTLEPSNENEEAVESSPTVENEEVSKKKKKKNKSKKKKAQPVQTDPPSMLKKRLANIYGLDLATGKDAETPIDMISDPGNNDGIDLQPTDIGDDEDNSPMSVNHASYSQNTNRRKRSRPSDGIASGLEMIAESVRELISETKEEVRILADSMRQPKLTVEMQQFLRVELRRLGLAVDVRVKAMNIFLASPDKFEVLKGYDEDEEKFEYIYACIGP